MDASYVAKPDFKVLFERAVVNLEHQSTPVTKEKIKTIGNYNLQQIAEERLPPLSVIASHLPKEKSYQSYVRTPSYETKLHFLDLGEDNIMERLNRVRNKIYNYKELSVAETLELGVIVLFAPRDKGNKITREVVGLYRKISDYIYGKLELVLYGILYVMIDAFFNDEEEYEEMMKMLKEKTTIEAQDEFENQKLTEARLNYTSEQLELTHARLNYANEQIEALTDENNNITTKYNEAQERIAELEKELKILKNSK